MRGARRLLGIAGLAAAAACATAPSRVRDLDGNPVPLYSVPAHGPVQQVRCDDGRDYLIVLTPPPPFLVGAGFGDVLRAGNGGVTDVCSRILASRL